MRSVQCTSCETGRSATEELTTALTAAPLTQENSHAFAGHGDVDPAAALEVKGVHATLRKIGVNESGLDAVDADTKTAYRAEEFNAFNATGQRVGQRFARSAHHHVFRAQKYRHLDANLEIHRGAIGFEPHAADFEFGI